MELDEKIIHKIMERFGITKEEVTKQLQELIDNGLLEKNDSPNFASEYRLTPNGSRFAEKQIIEKFGEFKKVIDHRGIAYKVPTIVIIREGIKENELNQFPLWSDEI